MDISGTRALVTGGSNGIGLEIARQLLERGARVVITGGRKAVLDQAVHALAGSRRITGISAEVTTPEGRQRSLHGTLAALGGLDILVNNAGDLRETPMMATPGMNPPGGRDTAAAVGRDTYGGDDRGTPRGARWRGAWTLARSTRLCVR
jgi:NAD(P)-dependent dehydrogenase (short-subunit alcohol dehydrogenase family)